MDWETLFLADWPVKLVSVILIIAAWIDGKELRVPNWITYP
ncbi:Type IV prepilin peptidase TadV/CpaA, partial [hydrothermal vent metagenome]